MPNIERLESNIQRALTEILRKDVKDSKAGFITITGLHLTRDLSFLTVYYTVLGGDKYRKSVTESLLRAKGFIRKQLSQKVKMRKTPTIIFKYDESIDYGNKIDNILNSLKKNDEN